MWVVGMYGVRRPAETLIDKASQRYLTMGRIKWYNSYIMEKYVQKNPDRRHGNSETQWAAAYTWVDYMKEITPSVLDNDPPLMVYYVHRMKNRGNK